MDEEEIFKKWMMVALDTSLALEGFCKFYLLTCWRRSLVSGTQNDIAVS